MKSSFYLLAFFYFRFGFFSRDLKKIGEITRKEKKGQFDPRKFYGKRWPEIGRLLSRTSGTSEQDSISFFDDLEGDRRMFELG